MVSAISEGLRLLFIWEEKEQRSVLTKLLGRTGLEFWKLEHDLGKTEEKHGKTSLVQLVSTANGLNEADHLSQMKGMFSAKWELSADSSTAFSWFQYCTVQYKKLGLLWTHAP